MFCKYCGVEVTNFVDQLVATSSKSPSCHVSPTKKHQLSVAAQKICIYCGAALIPIGAGLKPVSASSRSPSCHVSPTKEHQLG
jgi:hypothetical protein